MSRGSVYKRGTHHIAHIKWKHSDGTYKQRKVTRPTKDEAEQALTEMLRQVDLGIAVPADQMTFAQWVHGWLDHLEHVVGRKRTTIAGYRGQIERYAFPTIGQERIQRIGAPDINAIYRTMGRNGLAAATIRQLHRVLNKCFGDAEKQGVIPTNPVRRASPPSASAAKVRPASTWSWDQLAKFLDHIEGRGLSEPITFAALTGCRRGEVIGLRWSHLDLDARTATLEETVTLADRQLVVSDTKNHRSRPVGLDDHLVTMLRRHRVAQAEWRLQVGKYWIDRDLVFPGADGDYLKPETLSQQFIRLAESSGMPRIRFHDLRHTHGTLMVQSGLDAKLVSERLGHSKVGFTLDRYVHPTTEQQIDAANMFTSRLRRRAD